jgi:hypothetical protein
MAAYQVMMTFEVPQLRSPREWEIRLPRFQRHLRIYGANGLLSVTGTVREDSPADAAITVATVIMRQWDKSEGPIKVASWTAHRERAFAGVGRRSGGVSSEGLGLRRLWDDEGPDEGGSAGVREPRRPLPGPGSMSAALELPRD